MSERSHSRTPPPDRRPARGIRGGKAARRKREAYLRHQEAQGFDRRSVGIIHTGGLARPLYTPCTWEPESTTDEEGETAVFVDPEGLQQNLVDIVDLEAPAPLLPLSRPTPETVLLKARPKGPVQPNYPPPAKPAGPKQPNHPPPAVKGSLGVRPSSSSSATNVLMVRYPMMCCLFSLLKIPAFKTRWNVGKGVPPLRHGQGSSDSSS